MFEVVGPSAEPSLSPGVKWTHLGLFALLALALTCLAGIVIGTRRNSGSALRADTSAHPAAPPTQSEARAETEVEIGTEVGIGAWRVVLDNTHDVKDAGNAGIAPDQRDAVIFPGGELALAYGESEDIPDGSGHDLSVYGTAGDRTPYTVFVRADVTDRWIHVDANRNGFPRGVGSHDIRQPRVRQIKIRNDGTTNLFVDAIGVLSQPGSDFRDRAAVSPSEPDRARVSRAAPAAQQVTLVAHREPAIRTPVSVPDTPASPPSLQADVVQSPAEPPVAVQPQPEPRANTPSTAGGVAATVETPDRRAAVSSVAKPQPAAFELPQRIRSVAAQYPKVAQMANVQGTVVIEAIIDAGGKVISPRILKSIPLLDTAALDAVTQSEFKPAMRDGRPVPVNVTLSVEFTRP